MLYYGYDGQRQKSNFKSNVNFIQNQIKIYNDLMTIQTKETSLIRKNLNSLLPMNCKIVSNI